jgi:U3 small nucleolar RNA-associated protein 14
MITPMIAPMIHWNRAHTYLAEGGHKAISNEYGESIDSCVFSEIYVSNEDDSTQYFIDYIALLGDTTNIWEDSFPTSNSSTNGNNAIFSSSEIKDDDISSHDESVGESSSEL